MGLSTAPGDEVLLVIPAEVVVGILYAWIFSWFLHRHDPPSPRGGLPAVVLPFERPECRLKDAA
jgi:hypothetical protein